MAYQPTFPSPYMETIDVRQKGGNVFKCLINPKDVVVGATINIQEITGATNTLCDSVSLKGVSNESVGLTKYVYCSDSDKEIYSLLEQMIDKNRPLVMIDDDDETIPVTSIRRSRDGEYTRIYVRGDFEPDRTYNIYTNNMLSIELPETVLYGSWSDDSWIKAVVDSDSLINGRDYSWNITLTFDDETTLTSPSYYFKARKTPVVTLDNVPDIVNNCTHTFLASYSQEQRIKIAYYQFDLYRDGKLIDSSGQQFSQKIEYTFDSFMNDSTYEIELTIVNDEGVEAKAFKTFTVDYELLTSTIMPKINVDNYNARINVDYGNHLKIPSTLYGTETANYKSFGVTDYIVVTSGNVISYIPSSASSPAHIEISPYDNIMVGMYIGIGKEKVRIKEYIPDTYTAQVVLENDFTTTPSAGAGYEVYTCFNGIHLDDEQSIAWDKKGDNPLTLPDGSTQVIHWHGDYGFKGKIVEVYDSLFPWSSMHTGFDGQKFITKLNGETISETPLYTGTASAISGTDAYSVFCGAAAYTSSDATINIGGNMTDIIIPGNWIQIENYHCKIQSVNDLVITLDKPIPESVLANLSTGDNGEHYTFNCAVYDEDYIYELSDEDELTDTDMLIDNDKMSKYWWVIVFNPDGTTNEDKVKIMKSVLYEGEV